MKILFLDDMKERRNCFRSNSIGHSVDFAENAAQVLDFLRSGVYDMVYLDHDLAEDHYKEMKDDNKDGRYVCKELGWFYKNKNTIFIIHSLNIPARKEMKNILNEFGYIGFIPEDIGFSFLWQANPKDVYNKAINL